MPNRRILWGILAAALAATETTFAGSGREAPGTTNPPLSGICAQIACRKAPFDLKLRTREGGSIAIPMAAAPYVDDRGAISIYAGEALEFSFPDRNDTGHPIFSRVLDHLNLEGLRGDRPSKPGEPEPSGPATLSLEFKQHDGDAGMTLTLRNDTGVPLKFDATMFVPTSQGIESAHTSICTLQPGMMGTELWPHPIAMLLLANIQRAEAGQFSCE